MTHCPNPAQTHYQPSQTSVLPLEGRATRLLLVSANPAWADAVRGAVDDAALEICDARGAIVRLAGAGGCYSHLLLEPACEDGLFDALWQMTAAAGECSPSLLMLGAEQQPMTTTARMSVIASADRQTVQQALAARAGRAPQPSLDVEELRDALDRSLISARYQPIVGVPNRRFYAVEVLARLDHPERGMVLPDRFVPQIEDAGLAELLTELIAERAFAEMRDGYLRGLNMLVTLNFPLDVLLRSDAIDRLERQRQAAGIPASSLVVELTESIPAHDFDALGAVLERVRALGYRAAIDDVGPAVPSIHDLMELPFTSLKLDKDLVTRSEHDPAVEAFIAATTTRAHARGMAVIAEGIETRAAWRRMAAMGVDAVQGYFVARPLPAAAIPVWHAGWRALRDTD